MTDLTHDERIRSHVYDEDIREFDNRLPNWWLWTFYVACIFAPCYWLYFHSLGIGALPREEFRLVNEAAMERLAEMDVTGETLTALAAEPAAVEAGGKVFVKNCAQCHNATANGNIGPNLTDAYWLHGGAPLDIHTVVVTGVPEKGMPDYWLRTLGPLKCQQVVAYILSIRNTNVPGKAPQGDLYP